MINRLAGAIGIFLVAAGSVFSQSWSLFSSNKAAVNAFLGASNGTFYIATEDSGLYRMASGSTTLTKCYLPAAPDKIRDLLEGKQGKIFAATYYGLYVSTDNGSSWTVFEPNFPEYNVRSLAMNNATGDIYAGTDYQYIMKTSDNGISWNKVRDSSSKIRGIDYIEVNQTTGTVYAAAGSYSDSSNWTADIYSSSNGGTSWNRISLPNAPQTIGYNLGTAPDGTVYVSYRAYGSQALTVNGIYRSTNDGGSWTKLDSGYAASFAFSGNTVYGSAFGVISSTNKGQTWSSVGTGLPNGAIVLMMALNKGKLYAAVRGGGIYTLDATAIVNSSSSNAPFRIHPAIRKHVDLGRRTARSGAYGISGRFGTMNPGQLLITK